MTSFKIKNVYKPRFHFYFIVVRRVTYLLERSCFRCSLVGCLSPYLVAPSLSAALLSSLLPSSTLAHAGSSAVSWLMVERGQMMVAPLVENNVHQHKYVCSYVVSFPDPWYGTQMLRVWE